MQRAGHSAGLGILLLAFGWPATVGGQSSSAPLARTAADLIVLPGGERLLGSVLGVRGDGTVLLAVDRDWLTRTLPPFAAAEATRQREAEARALAELQRRIERWISERPDDKPLQTFLEAEQKRLAALAAAPPGPAAPLLLLQIPPADVRRSFRQPPERRRLLQRAWQAGLDDPTNRNSTALLRELRGKGLDPTRGAPDLGTLLGPQLDDEQAWAARVALVEYRLRKPLDFQGTSQLLVPANGHPPAADVGQLLEQALQASLQQQVGQLLGGKPAGRSRRDPPRDWLAPAIAIAEREDVRGFLVSRLEDDYADGQVAVEAIFVARMPDGRWLPVARFQETVTAGRQDAASVETVRDDPQVRQVVDTLAALGLPVPPEKLAWALAVGAATQEAKRKSDARFLEFQETLLRRLDQPPILAPATK